MGRLQISLVVLVLCLALTYAQDHHDEVSEKGEHPEPHKDFPKPHRDADDDFFGCDFDDDDDDEDKEDTMKDDGVMHNEKESSEHSDEESDERHHKHHGHHGHKKHHRGHKKHGSPEERRRRCIHRRKVMMIVLPIVGLAVIAAVVGAVVCCIKRRNARLAKFSLPMQAEAMDHRVVKEKAHVLEFPVVSTEALPGKI